MGLKTNANNQNIVPSVNMKPTPFPVLLYCGTLMEALLQCLINSCSCILMRIASWPLYRDAYRIVTLLAIHSPSKQCVGSAWYCIFSTLCNFSIYRLSPLLMPCLQIL